MSLIDTCFSPIFLGDDHIEHIFVIGIIFFCIACGFFLIGYKHAKQAKTIQYKYHVTRGIVTYNDLESPAKPLFSPRLYLTGKPDYVVKKNKTYIPVEVKSGRYNQPQHHHALQLAAYCALIEYAYQTFVPHGIVVYPTGQHTIAFTPKLRFQLEKTIKEMKSNNRYQHVKRNHHNIDKCKVCSLQQYCQDKVF